jgi:hypothetical protein
MPAPSTELVCRSLVVLVYLVALAVAGGPGWGTPLLALALAAVWAAPLTLPGRGPGYRRPPASPAQHGGRAV